MSGSPTFEGTFQWNRFASDLTFAFEASADLQSWTPVAATVLDSTTGQATVRISVPRMPYFIRLSATQ